MAICLASGVKAQFYDSAEDVYFYLEYSEDGKLVDKEEQNVLIFNFDGKRACITYGSPKDVTKNLKNNPDYYPDLFENKEYDLEYTYSSSGTCYTSSSTDTKYDSFVGKTTVKHNNKYAFSSDRNTLTKTWEYTYSNAYGAKKTHEHIYVYKRVDKSFFKVGRSRTPSGTLYE